MSNQSPSANGQDQHGNDPASSAQQQPRARDETGATAGLEPRTDAVARDPDIEHTEDPSKD
jgi:hypothetical protein